MATSRTILAHAEEVSGKRAREALLEHADLARLSRELVTIQLDVPVQFDAAAMARQEPDREALARVLAELEFYGLARRMGLGGAAGPGGSGADVEATAAAPLAGGPAEGTFSELQVTVVDDSSALPALAARLRTAPLLALDTETTSLEPHDAELIGLSLAASADRGLVPALRTPAPARRPRGTRPGAQPAPDHRPRLCADRRVAARRGRAEGGAEHQV